MSLGFLPSLAYGSFLAYAPRPRDAEGEKSRELCHRIKQDQFFKGRQLIPFAVERLLESRDRDLHDLLSPNTLLVPAPRSAPFSPTQRNVLWVPRRICQELLAKGFGAGVEELIVRKTPVEKSAYMARGQRPTLADHYHSMEIASRVATADRITIVDDVITKGTTLLAAATLLAEKYPLAEIRCFALIRTKGWAFRKIVDPVYGVIENTRWGARRSP